MKELKEFAFVKGGRRIRDWDKLLDGGIYLLESGVDFKCKATSMRSVASAVAKNRGKKLRATIKPDGNVVIQAYDPVERNGHG